MNAKTTVDGRNVRRELTIRYADATRADYGRLSRHHYRDRPPATFCAIRGAWFADRHATRRRRLVGVAVLAWPVGCCAARMRHFGQDGWGYGERLRFANEHFRTIARVIVHPQFRALGIGRRLVCDLVDRCPTRYVEASATMGEFARVFVAAGFSQISGSRPVIGAAEPAYFLLDRFPTSPPPPRPASSHFPFKQESA